MNSPDAVLNDGFERAHKSLRISVTDRCNIRCSYCMPAEQIVFKPRHELLTFEEITRFVTIAARLGIRNLRITGGEPLVRADVPDLVQMLSHVPGIEDLALTTNGMLLADQAAALKRAGLRRINISLDTLDEARFRELTRRSGLAKVIAGIEAAIAARFAKVRVNAIAIRGQTEQEIPALVRFAVGHDVELRFIEFMPLDADGVWSSAAVLSGAEIRTIIESQFGALDVAQRPNVSQPAVDYRLRANGARIGFINPVSQPFCESCDRLRLTAEGQIRNCLFSVKEWDARMLLRTGASEDELGRLIRSCVAAKKAGHGIDLPDFVRPELAMYQIGG